MKNLIRLSILLIIVGLSTYFTACKKDAKDLENSYMDFMTGEYGLWVGENDLRYIANLAPGTLSGNSVSINYSSQADPTGYTIDAAYYNTTLEYGRDVYNIQKIDRSFDLAASTNAEDGCLAVNPGGDVVTIDIGNGAFVETINFEGKHDPLLVADVTIGGNGYIMGNIIYYNEDADRPEIKIYSETDPSGVLTMPNDDLGDDGYYHSDSTSSHHYFGSTMYSLVMVYEPDNAPGFDNEVEVDFDAGTLYVEIEGKTYSVPIEGETIYQTIMEPVN